MPFPEWTNQLTSRETDDLQLLLEDLERLKTEGLTGGAVVISFNRRLLQPIHDRLHPAYEYWGQTDPTRVIRCKVSKDVMVVRVKSIFARCIRNRTCPKALSLYQPTNTISLQS
jgi:diphthamide synthase (EF-2-diphthine--ammonia ligase)